MRTRKRRRRGEWGSPRIGGVKLGLFGINMGAASTPEAWRRRRGRPRRRGSSRCGRGSTSCCPIRRCRRRRWRRRIRRSIRLLALAWAAACTPTLRLATGIVILPQRNPVVLAKQVASLDVLSAGRFTLGVGVGYLEPEFRAIGADFEHRGAVTDEFLDAMQHLWYDEHPAFHGDFADFAGVDAYPRPVQRRSRS